MTPTVRLIPGTLPAALVGGLAMACGVALTTTSGWLIVAASFEPPILTLLVAIVLVRAFGIARPALRYVERVRSHDAALSYLAEERARTYERLIPLTPARLGRRSRGDVLAGVVDDLDDIASAQVRVVTPLVALAVTGLLAVVADGVLLLPAALVTGSAVLWALVVGFVNYALERRAQAAHVAARARISRICALLSGNALDLAAVGAQEQALTWLDDAHAELARTIGRQSSARAVGVAGMPLVTVAHAVLMAAVVSPWISVGLPTPFAAFLVLTPVALGEVVSGVPDAVDALSRAQGATRRLGGLLDQPPAVADPAMPDPAMPDPVPTPPPADPESLDAGPCTPPVISLRGVRATWDGTRADVGPFDVEVAPGQFVGVVGANGSGKSTLLAVLARHLDPRAGRYEHDGHDVCHLPLEEVRSRMAVVDDEPHIFASTLRENLRLSRPGCADEKIEEALRQAGLGTWFDGLSDGLDTTLGAEGRGVSGGERSRLAIARAVLSGRAVVLLDEPVAHLDHPTALAVLRDLRHATRGRTVVLVSHRPEGLYGADQILRLGPEEPYSSPQPR
ncbi:MAG: thiol reductant ABC exporter subunit CydC [Dermatophilaceae bacterium]